MECASSSTAWRSESRQKDGSTLHKRLYLQRVNTVTRGTFEEAYMVDAGVDMGAGPGDCLRYEGETLKISGCQDNTLQTDWQLKSNGMLCVDSCRYCVLTGEKGLVVGKCGVSEDTIAEKMKHLIGGGKFTLAENLAFFEAVDVVSPDASYKASPTAVEWRRCNWESEGSVEGKGDFLNDIWPMVLRRQVCTKKATCAFDEITGTCRVKK